MPRIIDRLEIKKLVKRSTSALDKRETVITLTQGGITLLEASTVVLNKILDESLVITEQDALALNGLLEKVRLAES
ncbi:MAG: hypothetical protein IM587_02810 [Chitinophagaceae bacterium]|nr:hypothetical protein [Chitinophagaceae bacterium]